MGFLGLGRSPLKDADPRRREQAVRDLPVAEQGTFIELALGDPDAGVRVAAATRVREPDFLEMISKHKDPAVAKIGRERLANIGVETVKGRKLAGAKVILDAINEQNALATITLQAEDREVRSYAFERMLGLPDPSPDMLARVAVQDEDGALGQRAVAKIDKRQALKSIAKKAKNEAVRKAAQSAITAIDEEARKPSPDKQRRSRAKDLEPLLERAQVLAVSQRWDETPAEFAELKEKQAAVIASYPEIEPCERCAEVAQIIERAAATFSARKAEAEALVAEQAEHATAKQQLLEELAKEQPENAEAAAAAARQRWQAIGSAGEADGALAHRFNDLLSAWTGSSEHAVDAPASERPAPKPVTLSEEEQAKIDALLKEAAELSESDNWKDADYRFKELDKLWRDIAIDLPADHELRQQFLGSYGHFKDRRRADREQRDQQNEARVAQMRELVVKAEAFAAQSFDESAVGPYQKELKALQAEWKDIGKVPGRMMGDLRKQFRTACDKAYAPLKKHFEARDWERFNNIPKAEELIEGARALAEVEDLESVYTRVKDLQAQWKKVGQLPRERKDELWEQFKAACDAAYERLQALFAERDADRQTSMQRKEAMIAELQQLIGSPVVGIAGSQAHRDAINQRTEQVKAMQAEWKALGPAPREHDRELWQRWKQVQDQFFNDRRSFYDQLDQEKVENLNAKLALIVEAKDLAEDAEKLASGTPVGSKSEADFHKAVRELQQQWRHVGHVPRDRFEEIRDNFKQACDRVYAAVEPWLAKQDDERQSNLEAKQRLLKELYELFEEERPEWFKEDARKIQQQWREIGHVPRNAMAINDEFQSLCDDLFNGRKPEQAPSFLPGGEASEAAEADEPAAGSDEPADAAAEEPVDADEGAESASRSEQEA